MLTSLSESIHRFAATDITMKALEFRGETLEVMDVNYSVKTWNAIVTGIEME